YVLVILKTSANPVPKGPERDAMFRGHFANMKKLSDAGKLAFAGPFGDKNAGEGSWRGMFVFAVPTIEEAKALTATDPVLQQGEMVAEYHELFGSASLMLVPETYLKVAKKPM
ncbi:MAG: YciI family protein, partial [Gammaproteobacteria bacterium]|nr:YciI family protein [Gammaproteobacteria bacterium]